MSKCPTRILIAVVSPNGNIYTIPFDVDPAGDRDKQVEAAKERALDYATHGLLQENACVVTVADCVVEYKGT